MKVHINIFLKRIILWTLVAVYTLLLPYAFIIYSATIKYFSSNAAGRISIIAILLIGTVYCIYSCKKSRGIKPFVCIILSSIVIYGIISIVPNPNKHIHIPEYIIMSWLIYKALAIDYKGKGIFILILFISILLGIIDELEQGIHANRFYGLSDMIVNSLSSVIGMLLLMGSRKWTPGEWTWADSLKDHKMSIGLILIGIIGVILICIYLFDVQESGKFLGVYPIWLLMYNGLYFMLIFIDNIIHMYRHVNIRRVVLNKEKSVKYDAISTVHLWIVIPSVILLIMHFLPVYIAISGQEFR